jgi:hypothetical protein
MKTPQVLSQRPDHKRKAAKAVGMQLIGLATSATLSFFTNAARAQGTAFTYQGRLNVNGAEASGTYDFRYRLALDPFGNNYFGSSVLAGGQILSNGLFAAALDFGPGAFNGGSYWLEVDVRTNGAGRSVDFIGFVICDL